MDFDTEAADDHRLAVKNWEDVLPLYLNCAGASSSDCESDNGLLTPPPDGQEDMDTVWIDPPPRPAYSDSWIRVMKKRVNEGCYSPVHDNDSDTSSVSSYSSDMESCRYTQYALPADSHGSRGSCSDEFDGLAFSDDSIDGGYKEGSTATIADAEDLFAEMIAAYTVPKELKNTILRHSSPKRKQSSSSLSRDKPAGVSKRSFRSSPRSRSFRTG